MTGTCLQTLRGHADYVRRRRPDEQRVDRSSTQRGAQVWCVAVMSNGHVVSGSGDRTVMVWDASSGECLKTLRGHTGSVRRRRPVKQSVRAIRGAGQFSRHPAKRPHRVRVERYAQGVAEVDRRVPPDADRAHGLGVAPASSQTARQLLVDAATGAGPVRRRPVERPHRVRIGRPHAQGLGRVERCLPPDIARAQTHSAGPASSQTARQLLVDAATGAGPVRRRPVERPHRVRIGRPHAQGLGRVERCLPPDIARAQTHSAGPASSQTARRSLVDAATGAGPVRRRPVRPRCVRVGRQHAQGLGRL